jgi:hypothetical protein
MARMGVAGGRVLHRWTQLLRRQARGAGMAVNDSVFGLAWSGHMTEARVLQILAALPDGVSEIYFHPASGRDALIDATMPDYEHEAELAALLSPLVRARLDDLAVKRIGYGDLG